MLSWIRKHSIRKNVERAFRDFDKLRPEEKLASANLISSGISSLFIDEEITTRSATANRIHELSMSQFNNTSNGDYSSVSSIMLMSYIAICDDLFNNKKCIISEAIIEKIVSIVYQYSSIESADRKFFDHYRRLDMLYQNIDIVNGDNINYIKPKEKYEPPDYIIEVRFEGKSIIFTFRGGGELKIPFDNIPKFNSANLDEIRNIEFYGIGEAVYWPKLGIYISVKDLLSGKFSNFT